MSPHLIGVATAAVCTLAAAVILGMSVALIDAWTRK